MLVVGDFVVRPRADEEADLALEVERTGEAVGPVAGVAVGPVTGVPVAAGGVVALQPHAATIAPTAVGASPSAIRRVTKVRRDIRPAR